MLWIVIAPIINAITALGGMPSVSIGMNDVCAPALLADSGAATPRMLPWPNGGFAFLPPSFFSTVYAAKEASSAPPPGSTPSTAPMPVPRSTAPEAAFTSAQVGISEPTLSVNTWRFSPPVSRLATISAKPNTPIATPTNPMPSASSGMSNA